MAITYLETMPKLTVGQKIGLFGGSFNPPHEGHLLVARTALASLSLDRLWWMVTPGNPLKNKADLLGLDQRIQESENLLKQMPNIDITAFESTIDAKTSFETLKYILSQPIAPMVSFVWVMGGDNLADFHRWYRWRDLANMMPVAVVCRPTAMQADKDSHFAVEYKNKQLPVARAAELPFKKPPSWCYLCSDSSDQSSTNLRKLKAMR